MAMSKEEKNARRRAAYAAKKAEAARVNKEIAARVRVGTRPTKKSERAYLYPTPKHGLRYGGEGNQLGLIGPPRKYKPRKPKASAPPAAKKGIAPKMVRKAVARVAGGTPTKKLRKSRRKGAVTVKL